MIDLLIILTLLVTVLITIIIFSIINLIKLFNMNIVLRTFLRGLVIAIIISLPQFPADGKLTTFAMYGVLATIISYCLTHVIMLAPFIKQELSAHFKWNISSTVSTALFTIINAAGMYLVNGLTNHTTITLTAFIGVIWGGIIYAVKNFAENSYGKIAVENPDKLQPPGTN